MNINFYEYTIGDKTTYLEPEYMGYKYSDTKKLGSVSGQTDLSIYYSPPCESTPTCVTYAVLKRDEDGYDPCGPLYETKNVILNTVTQILPIGVLIFWFLYYSN